MGKEEVMHPDILKRIESRRMTPAIIIADKNSEMDKIDTYITFIKLFNNISNGKHQLSVNWNKDFYEVDINNVPETMRQIEEITERIKQESVVLVSGGIRNEIFNYYEWAEPYFNFLARSAGKFINISSYIEPIFRLSGT